VRAEVCVREAGQGRGVLGAKVLNPVADVLQLRKTCLDPLLRTRQEGRQARADRLARPAEVDRRELLDLLDRQPERAKIADDLRAPQRRVVEEAIVPELRPAE
jgi:hypothetical protein